MRWASAISTAADYIEALDEATATVVAGLDSTSAHVVFVFVSMHHREHFVRVPKTVAERFPGAVVLGCSGGGVVGDRREIEDEPSVSLLAGAIPGAEFRSFHVAPELVGNSQETGAGWPNLLGLPSEDAEGLIVLTDPYSFNASEFVAGLDFAYPAAAKVGGLASGASQPGQLALFADGQVHGTGAVGLWMRGNVELDTIVAQGCRPIGTPMFVTRADRNTIVELDGRRPPEVIRDLYEQLTEADRELMRHSLFIGLVINDDREVYHEGDFLIRNIIGIDAHNGALAIGAEAQRNRVVQFHLRDARTSAAELEFLLERHAAENLGPPAAALMFSCLGRGMGLYGVPNHDLAALQRRLGEMPAAGFFCNGEIGPIQGQTYVHGYTTAFGLFRGKRTH